MIDNDKFRNYRVMNIDMNKRNLKAVVAFLVLSLCPFVLSAQFDALNGDGLDFSHGYSGWVAKTGSYSNSSSSSPSWGWTQTHTDPTVPQDAGGKFFQIFSDANALDSYSNNQLHKVPTQFGCQYSSQINNYYGGASCSQLEYTMEVSSNNSLLTIYYAMVLELPHSGQHYINPTFQIDVMAHDPATNQMTNDLVEPCAFFEQSGDLNTSSLPTGWHAGQYGWAYCDWQQVKINLKKHEGNRITLRIRLSDCSYSAHGGYGYIAAKAEPAKIDVPGCAGNGDTVTVAYAPAGFQEYKWFEVDNIYMSQDDLAAADAAAPSLSTSQELVVTNAMMGTEPVRYYACKIKAAAMYPSWGTVRPQCAAYITTQVNDIRPIFNLQATEPGADDPAGRTIFFVSDVAASGAPLYWQQYDFGDGTTPIQIEKQGTQWVVLNEAENPATTYEYDDNNSLERLIHVYASEGTYLYTRTVRSSEDPEAEELVYCEKFDTKNITIPKVPSLLLSAEEEICVGETAVVTATSPDDEGADLTYYWWHSNEAMVAGEDPVFEGAVFNEQITDNTTYVVKVVDNESGYYRVESITVNVQAFPEVTLTGATKLCMGDRAEITASDATGNAVAFEWTFTRPSNPPVMNNPSANAVLSFTPTKDTTVYLIARTNVGCIAYDSIVISVIDPQVFSSVTEICPGDVVSLWGENAVEYSWTANPPDESLTTERVTGPIDVSPQVTTTYTMSGYGETGCHTDKEIKIKVYPYPEATITFTPSYVDVDNPILSISDVSPNATSSSWTFSDGATSTARTVTHSFNDLSNDFVSIYLTTYNQLGCSDTASVYVPIELFGVWMPNSFTPNGDGMNDKIFFSSLNNLEDVHFEIFNRQGLRLYQLHEAHLTCGVIPDLATLLGWDGTYKGKECPQGTYVYRLSYRRSGNTKVYDFTGNIMLFR